MYLLVCNQNWSIGLKNVITNILAQVIKPNNSLVISIIIIFIFSKFLFSCSLISKGCITEYIFENKLLTIKYGLVIIVYIATDANPITVDNINLSICWEKNPTNDSKNKLNE